MTQSLVFETQTVTHKNVKENCFLVKQGIFEFCRRWLKSLEAKKKFKDGPVIPENLRATWIFLSKKWEANLNWRLWRTFKVTFTQYAPYVSYRVPNVF